MNSADYTRIDFYSGLNPVQTLLDGPEDESVNYANILKKVQMEIAQNHSEELSEVLSDKSSEDTLRVLISKCLIENSLVDGDKVDNSLVERIFQDMAGLGILTKWIRDEGADEQVEEININSFNNIEIVLSTRTIYLQGKEAFPNPTTAVDLVKKLVRMSGNGTVLSRTTPRVDSFIGGGTRISAMVPPAVPEERGVSAEIRRQNKSFITKEQLLKGDCAMKEELDFINLVFRRGISVGIAGGTGSGKTTDQAYILNEYLRNNNDWNNRIFVIEDSRELVLYDKDERRNTPTRIIYTLTHDGDEDNTVTMRDLIKDSLRYHPHIIVPVEVRGAEALDAVDAGLTGHTILTSLHAQNVYDAYDRLLDMCMMANSNLKENTLLKQCIKAWPIMVYKEQLRDGSRKYMQVFEATGIEDDTVTGNLLFQYVIEKEILKDDGTVKEVVGHHERCGCISEKLYKQLRGKGVPKEEITKLFPEVEKYESAK